MPLIVVGLDAVGDAVADAIRKARSAVRQGFQAAAVRLGEEGTRYWRSIVTKRTGRMAAALTVTVSTRGGQVVIDYHVSSNGFYYLFQRQRRQWNQQLATYLERRAPETTSRPWAGCSPPENAGASRDLLAQVEKSLTDEHKTPVANVAAVPEPDQSQDVADAIAAGGGHVLLGESTDVGVSDGNRTDWKPHRYGPDPSEVTPTIRQDIERSLLAAAGVPVELVLTTSGTDAREGWRLFLWSTVAPAMALVSAELRRLGLDADIDLSGLNASDLAGRARAYSQLTKAGMVDSEARKICGF